MQIIKPDCGSTWAGKAAQVKFYTDWGEGRCGMVGSSVFLREVGFALRLQGYMCKFSKERWEKASLQKG